MSYRLRRGASRITKLTEGFDFIGYQFVKRRSPNTGNWTMYIFPNKTFQRNIRRRIKYFTKRRSPENNNEYIAVDVFDVHHFSPRS